MNLLIRVAALLFTFLICIQIVSGSGGTQFTILTDSAKTEKSISQKLQLVNKYKNSDIKQAMGYARQALADAEIINSRKYIAESKLAIGSCYDVLGVNSEALLHIQEALDVFTELKENKKRAETLLLLGNIYYFSLEYEKAMVNFRQVSSYGREQNDTLLLIQGAIGQGSVYGNTNKFDTAMIFFNESFLLARKFGDQATEVKSLFYIGDVFLYSGRPHEALEKFREVEKNYDVPEVNPGIETSLYNSVTLAYIMTRNLEMAKYYSRKTFNNMGDSPSLILRRSYYMHQFQIDTSEHNYESALNNYIMYKVYFDSINYTELKKNINNFNTVYELKQKESEIARLTNESLVKDLKIKQRQLMVYGSGVLVIMLFFIIYQILRTSRKIEEKNLILQIQGEELKSAMTDLQNTQRQLIQSEKMSALGVLASGVSHEINNPLNFILAGVQCIKDQCERHGADQNKTEIDFYAKAIGTGVEKITAIVTGLNRFSRSGESIHKMLDIHEVANTCILMLNYLTENRIEIVKEFTGSACIVYGVEAKLHQVVLSIMLNAIQSIESNGTIIIKTEIQGTQVKISISDTGCGISKENLPRIMDPFFTTKLPGEGTGLGLSIAYKMLKEHSGKIDFQSVPGKGTTVSITLPLHK